MFADSGLMPCVVLTVPLRKCFKVNLEMGWARIIIWRFGSVPLLNVILAME